MEIDIKAFAAMVRAHRGTRGLRVVAKELEDVSSSTLSRIEQGNLPDLNTFMRLCRWMEVSPERFTAKANKSKSKAQTISTQEIVYAHLRGDRILEPKTVNALITMIEAAYKAVESGAIKGKGAKRETRI